LDTQVLTEWATRFRDGDERSFKRLVDALTRTLIAMAYRYTGDWEWARDLTQETWIRVHRQIARYDPARSFVTWLHAIHRNGCLDHVRRPWVRRESAPGPAAMVRLGGPAPDDPSVDLERREFHERVLAATRGLSESQRQVFVRVDLERNAQAEVARELGIRAGTLRTTLHFARRKVAAALHAMEEGM
jgi:RNA polymerase sigma-70 factor (ECF subfamily)